MYRIMCVFVFLEKAIFGYNFYFFYVLCCLMFYYPQYKTNSTEKKTRRKTNKQEKRLQFSKSHVCVCVFVVERLQKSS